jgi:hypothetical protein
VIKTSALVLGKLIIGRISKLRKLNSFRVAQSNCIAIQVYTAPFTVVQWSGLNIHGTLWSSSEGVR